MSRNHESVTRYLCQYASPLNILNIAYFNVCMLTKTDWWLCLWPRNPIYHTFLIKSYIYLRSFDSFSWHLVMVIIMAESATNLSISKYWFLARHSYYWYQLRQSHWLRFPPWGIIQRLLRRVLPSIIKIHYEWHAKNWQPHTEFSAWQLSRCGVFVKCWVDISR